MSRTLAHQYFSEIVTRYLNRSSVLIWELGNELNLLVDLPPPVCGNVEYLFSVFDATVSILSWGGPGSWRDIMQECHIWRALLKGTLYIEINSMWVRLFLKCVDRILRNAQPMRFFLRITLPNGATANRFVLHPRWQGMYFLCNALVNVLSHFYPIMWARRHSVKLNSSNIATFQRLCSDFAVWVRDFWRYALWFWTLCNTHRE